MHFRFLPVPSACLPGDRRSALLASETVRPTCEFLAFVSHSLSLRGNEELRRILFHGRQAPGCHYWPRMTPGSPVPGINVGAWLARLVLPRPRIGLW